MTLSDAKFNIILRSVSRHITLSPRDAEEFRSLLTYRRLRRRQYLLQEGDVCMYESYVLKGCLRAYAIDRNGFEHISMFAAEDWWISDLDSLIHRTPAQLTIDALEDSELLQLDWSAFQRLYEKVPQFERFFRILLQNAFIAHQQRILNTISLTAEQRYHEFVRKYNDFVRRIPQKHVAAYLGITPEFLSRIRRKAARRTPRS
jgi:CRP-like cAMP-binding protein